MTVSREPVCGVVRLSGVYTPPEKRKHGYAEACGREGSNRLHHVREQVRFVFPRPEAVYIGRCPRVTQFVEDRVVAGKVRRY